MEENKGEKIYKIEKYQIKYNKFPNGLVINNEA